MTKTDLGCGILEVDLKVFAETIGINIYDTSNGSVNIADISLFFDEFESLYNIMGETLKKLKSQPVERIIPVDQQFLI